MQSQLMQSQLEKLYKIANGQCTCGEDKIEVCRVCRARTALVSLKDDLEYFLLDLEKVVGEIDFYPPKTNGEGCTKAERRLR